MEEFVVVGNAVDVGCRGLVALPARIFEVLDLESLRAHANEIIVLPPRISLLHALKVLWVQNNQLTALPDAICELPNLEILLADHNQITVLSASFGRLHKLEGMDASGQLRLDLRSNPLEHPPLSIAEQGPGAIARYFDTSSTDAVGIVTAPASTDSSMVVVRMATAPARTDTRVTVSLVSTPLVSPPGGTQYREYELSIAADGCQHALRARYSQLDERLSPFATSAIAWPRDFFSALSDYVRPQGNVTRRGADMSRFLEGVLNQSDGGAVIGDSRLHAALGVSEGMPMHACLVRLAAARRQQPASVE